MHRMTKLDMELRNMEICKLYKSGKTILELEERYNIKKSRIHKILQDNDIKTRRTGPTLKPIPFNVKDIEIDRANGMKWKDIAKKYNTTINALYYYLNCPDMPKKKVNKNDTVSKV